MENEGESRSARIDAHNIPDVKPRRNKGPRTAVALNHPLAQEMWAKGCGINQIAKALGIPAKKTIEYFGCIDPTPQPLGCPPFSGRAGESGEARAFRRFPIDCHKPGPG